MESAALYQRLGLDVHRERRGGCFRGDGAMLKCKQEKLDALVREMDGCNAFICVAKFGDSVNVRAKGSLISVMPLILQGIVSVTRQIAGGDDDLQQRYLKVAAAALNTLAREGAAKEKAPEAAATALGAKTNIDTVSISRERRECK